MLGAALQIVRMNDKEIIVELKRLPVGRVIKLIGAFWQHSFIMSMQLKASNDLTIIIQINYL